MIPIGVDIELRRAPIGNWLLIAINVLIFIATKGAGADFIERALPPLDAAVPSLFQYITYQFRHGDWQHLLGNMLFLWIFGAAVCDRMGSLNYTLFYLAGGVFAGLTFAQFNDNKLVGASGAIAAVTTAFLAFYPRVRITMLLLFIVITTFQVPAMALIVLKIILWDNIVAPSINQGAMSSVAYSAHLGGYAFGLTSSLLFLAARGVSRNQFDLLALWSRWNRRTGIGGMPTGTWPARTVAAEELEARPLEAPELTQAEQLRDDILNRIVERDMEEAAALYRRLVALSPDEVLPRPQQMDIANYLAQTQRHAEAVDAYEAFLSAYPASADAPQIRLLLGLICKRHLRDYVRAIEHLQVAVDSLGVESQRALAAEELAEAQTHLAG